MTWNKGESGNIKGRPKGAKNKVGVKVAENVARMLQNIEEQVIEDLRQLEPNERVKAYTSLLPFVVPKQTNITAEAKIQKEYEYLEELLKNAPDEAVSEIATKVMEMQNEKLNTKGDE